MPTPDPGALFPLPTVDNAEHICVTLSIPGDQESISNFVGALFRLAVWNNYRRDDLKRGKNIAQVWKKIIADIEFGTCSIEPIKPHGMELEFDMGIRVDCDCRVWITCCDGTEKELALVDMLDKPGQPGTGQPQPPPNGGSACYDFVMNASQSVLLPTGVSTGDVIQIQNASGAGSNSYNGNWHLLSGNQFFLGADVGFPQYDASTPVPAAPITSLIVLLNGTPYAVGIGSFTVPSGYTNASVTLQVNDAVIAGLSGTFNFSACVTNNAVGSYTHEFDFTLAPGGWLIGHRPTGNPTGNTSWVAGQGFVSVADPAAGTNVGVIELWKEGVNLNGCSVRMVGSTPGSLPNNGIYTAPNGSYPTETACTQYLTSDPQTAIDITAIGFSGGVQDLMLLIFAPYNYATVIVSKCVISGPGVDPF